MEDLGQEVTCNESLGFEQEQEDARKGLVEFILEKLQGPNSSKLHHIINASLGTAEKVYSIG